MEILEHQQVVIEGDELDSHKAKINATKQGKLFKILSGLYSDIIGSITREYTSNAIDSHRTANQEDPILIKLTTENITIQDFGTGLSDQEVRDIYINYLESTKEDTNDVHGGFGLTY